ncbi:hypothetical protein LINGRAHAP2_LOCUS10258 [Linum grandiflorum]
MQAKRARWAWIEDS